MRRTRLMHKLAATAAVITLLGGCASTETFVQNNAARDNATKLNDIAHQPMAASDVSAVKSTDQVYVGASAHLNEHGDPLPSRWETGSFEVGKAGTANFQFIASSITQQTGIPVAIAGLKAGGGGSVSATSSAPKGGVAPSISGDASLGAAAAALSGTGVRGGPLPVISTLDDGQTDLGVRGSMRIAYKGKLAGYLDLVATNFNVAWEYRDGRIVFSRYLTRVFEVPALPISTKLAFSMSSGTQNSGSAAAGQGSTSTGTTEQTAKTEGEFHVWKDISENLQSIVGGDGSIQVSTVQGTVTVIAAPAMMKRVAEYLHHVNESLARQVAMSVKVYSVTLNDGDTFSSDMNVLFQNPGKYGLRMATSGVAGTLAAPPVTGANTPTPSNQGVGWAILNTKSNMQGSGIVQALSTRGDVSVVTSASVTTVNGQPVPFQVANTRGYLQSITSTVAGSSGTAQTSLTPGTVTTGFNLHLVPKIQNDGTIMLQYAMNISELVGSENGFETYSSGGQTIQLPNINERNFIQQAILPNDATLVLAGFEQVSANSVKTGNILPALWPLGGTSTQSMKREIMVITITPTILDVSAPASLSTVGIAH